MKKTNFLNTLMMLCLMSFSINSNAQELQINQPILPAQAVDIAQQALPQMLQLIEPQDMKDYGFNLSDNFSNIQIGRPFYVVSLPRTNTINNTETISLHPSTIMLPLILDGKARCILYVSPEDGTWKTVGIGEGNFVAAKQEIFNTNTNEDGSSHVIISIPHLSQQYLMTQGNETTFLPLTTFEGEASENISISKLMELNNAPILEAKDWESGIRQNEIHQNQHK